MTNKIRTVAAAFLFLGCLVTLTSAFNLPNRSKDVSSRLDSLRTLTKPAQHRTSLTFADRVAYQRAIEDVYWRHRIWPKERPDSKPSLDAVMSQAQLEKKVEDYLRNSQALEDYWQPPITAEQLQAELDRMAKHTKQPEVLRELFEALGNDPFVIAECLARPTLAERFGAGPTVLADVLSEPRNSFAAGTAASTENRTSVTANVAYTLPKISDGDPPCTNDTWTATSTTNAPSARYDHRAVWTGSEMIVWGGTGDVGYLDTGGRYNPTTDSWTATSTTNAPDGRSLHTAIWTGSEMIVWGGSSFGTHLDTGGIYNPTADTWAATTVTNAPVSRQSHTAVWTGSDMIVWGGFGNVGYLNSGGRYNPVNNTWVATSTINAPSARDAHTPTWTGSEMIIWGGENLSGYLNTGGKYSPGTDSWTATSTTNAPAARSGHRAVWTSSEMIIWGGEDNSSNDLNTGGRYNPGSDSWIGTSTANAPPGRFGQVAVWSGSEMIVWGGNSNLGSLDTGGRYCAQSAPMAQSAVSRKTHGAAGTFDINLPLTGTTGVESRSGAGTHDYMMVVTFSGNVAVTGSPQAQVTLGTGCVGTGGVCDPNGTVSISGNVVTIPLTTVADVQTINVQLNGVMGATDAPAVNVTIPMSVLIGDVNGNRAVNSSDVALTKSQAGQAVGNGNFREDVNASGTITATDVAIVKSDVGHALPP
jgi:N-acetylneuraminic acid mutarotase